MKEKQNWEIKYDGVATRLFINGVEIKHLKSIEFKHTVGADGLRDLPLLSFKVFAINTVEENGMPSCCDLEDTIKVMTLDSTNLTGEHFSKI